MVRYVGMACSGRGVTIVARKRLWSDHLGRGYVTIVGRKRLYERKEVMLITTNELTRVGIELLGQLKMGKSLETGKSRDQNVTL